MGPGLCLLLMSMRQSLIIWRILYGIAKKGLFGCLKLHTHVFLCFYCSVVLSTLACFRADKMAGTCLIEMYKMYLIQRQD